jgi:hypothetical protein
MDYVAAMRTEYRRGEAVLWSSLAVKATIFVCAILDAIWSDRFAKGALLFVPFAQAVLFFLRYRSSNHVERGDKLRVAAILEDGLGDQPSKMDIAALKYAVGMIDPMPQQGLYYTSMLPKGPTRLIENVAESAFFSGMISEQAASLIIGCAVISFFGLAFSSAAVVQLGAGTSGIDIASKLVFVGVQFWVTDELIAMALRYKAISNECQRITAKSEGLFNCPEPTMSQAYSILLDYANAMAQSPPLPAKIYKHRVKRLTDAWALRSDKARHSTSQTGS